MKALVAIEHTLLTAIWRMLTNDVGYTGLGGDSPGRIAAVAESRKTGDLAVDAHDPFALIAYGSVLLYCLQENLAAGGPAFRS